MKTILTAAALALAAGGASAQQAPQGCDDYDTHGQFDFWVGEWNVYAEESGDFGGVNSITKTSKGCLLLEQWTSAGGGDSTSMNFVDPDTGQWRQVWMGANNFIDYAGGLNEAGEMVLEGHITYFSDEGERSAPFRGVWTPLEDGTVRQHFEQQDEEGAWSPWFTGIYKPADTDENAAADALWAARERGAGD